MLVSCFVQVILHFMYKLLKFGVKFGLQHNFQWPNNNKQYKNNRVPALPAWISKKNLNAKLH